MHGKVLDIATETRRLDGVVRPGLVLCGLLAVVGIAGSLLVAGAVEGGTAYLLETYLVSFAFFLGISLGALFFVLLQHSTRAGWSVVSRRVAEACFMAGWNTGANMKPMPIDSTH